MIINVNEILPIKEDFGVYWWADGNVKGNGNAPSCLIAWGEDNYQSIKNVDGIFCRIEAQ